MKRLGVKRVEWMVVIKNNNPKKMTTQGISTGGESRLECDRLAMQKQIVQSWGAWL
jgi:hypothetical protein